MESQCVSLAGYCMVYVERSPCNLTGFDAFSKNFAVFYTKFTYRSGVYTYTFFYLNGANYKNIKLNGTTINQVHLLATADFVKLIQTHGKQESHSCSVSFATSRLASLAEYAAIYRST